MVPLVCLMGRLLKASAEGGRLLRRTTNSLGPILAVPEGMIRLCD